MDANIMKLVKEGITKIMLTAKNTGIGMWNTLLNQYTFISFFL